MQDYKKRISQNAGLSKHWTKDAGISLPTILHVEKIHYVYR